MFGADAGGEFFGGALLLEDLVADREGVFGERSGGDGDAELVTGPERAEVVGFALRNGDDDAGASEEGLELDTGGGEGLFVGFVADGEVVGEEDDAGGIGVGEADGAGVAERHGAIFEFRFRNFDLDHGV